jgi:hypothetical protein
MSLMQSTSSFVPAAESHDADPGELADYNGENWTEQQIILLVSLVRGEGFSNAEAAIKIGHTEPLIATAVSRYGARDPRAQLRTCMPCRRPFFSMHIGNRICGQCIKRHSLVCA